MSCKDCSETSSLTYSRCGNTVTTNCVLYTGDTLECSSDEDFKICKNENMTSIQESIFEKVCALSGSLDVQNVVIPDCAFIQDAWDDNDLTVLNLFNLVL